MSDLEDSPADALRQVGWLGPYGLIPGGMDVDPAATWQPVYVIVDPVPYRGPHTGSEPQS